MRSVFTLKHRRRIFHIRAAKISAYGVPAPNSFWGVQHAQCDNAEIFIPGKRLSHMHNNLPAANQTDENSSLPCGDSFTSTVSKNLRAVRIFDGTADTNVFYDDLEAHVGSCSTC